MTYFGPHPRESGRAAVWTGAPVAPGRPATSRRLAVALALLAALSATACGAGTNEPSTEETLPEMAADQVLFEIQHIVTGEGVKRAILDADTAYVFEDSSLVTLRGVHLTLLDAMGRQAADLTSLRGRMDTRTDRMVAIGNVVLITAEGDRRIETEELHFDPRRDRLWSDVQVAIYRGDSRIQGDGFTSTGQLRNLEIRNPTGRFEGLEFEF